MKPVTRNELSAAVRGLKSVVGRRFRKLEAATSNLQVSSREVKAELRIVSAKIDRMLGRFDDFAAKWEGLDRSTLILEKRINEHDRRMGQLERRTGAS